MFFSRFKVLLTPLLWPATLLLYSIATSRLTFPFRASQLIFELPFVSLLFSFLYLPLRPTKWRGLWALLPFCVLYASHDAYYLMLGAVPQIVDFSLLPELMRVMGWVWTLSLGTAAIVPILLWLANIDKTRLRTRLAPILLLLIVCVTTYIRHPQAAEFLVRAASHRVSWGEYKNVRYYGRLFNALVVDTKRRIALQKFSTLIPIESTDRYLTPQQRSQIKPRNITVVVLESFIDLQLFHNLHTDRDAFSPAFRKLAEQGESVAVSPQFGTGTANSEFELLCGVPSLRLIDSAEFNAFSGAPTYCLPAILRELGYRTIASFPDSPKYYNRTLAYQGLGFERSLFGERYTQLAKESLRMEGRHTFDGVVYQQNLTMLDDLKAQGKPVLNYIMTIYGHTPFRIDPERQPLVVQVQPENERLARMANQLYYRTQALADYVSALQTRDPDCLIVLVSDHPPPLPGGPAQYKELGFVPPLSHPHPSKESVTEAFLLVIDRGQVVRAPAMAHFQLRDYILDRLSDGAFCQQGCLSGDPHVLRHNGQKQLKGYQAILGRAAQNVERLNQGHTTN